MYLPSSFGSARWLYLFVFAFCCWSRDYHQAHLNWDASTLTLIQENGVYGRMVRLPSRELLCSFEWGGSIYVRRSADEGRTWSDPVLAATYPFGSAANPELLVLRNGSILLSFNERPRDGVHPFTIASTMSIDGGRTWGARALIYQAGTTSSTGCWEPAAIQLPSGEIELFFANEKPFPFSDEQEIAMVRSFDDGASWTAAERIALRTGHRDGMPVPRILNGGSGVAVAIEDNGIAGTFKPAILFTPLDTLWRQPVINGASPRRWSALQSPLAASVYAGGPYLAQFPSGETLLSVQSGADRTNPGTLDFSRMMVYLGDSNGRGFTNASEPFPVNARSSGLWNSLFIKNAVTVTAISGTTINGVTGIWAIDGRIEYPDGPEAPEIHAVVNAASGRSGAVAPGEIVSVFGARLTTAGQVPAIRFGSAPATVLYASPTQVNAVVPQGLGSFADAVVDSEGQHSYEFPLGVSAAAPGVFADRGLRAWALNEDHTVNSAANAAGRGSYLTFWVTGLGAQPSLGLAGRAVSTQPQISVNIAGLDAQVAEIRPVEAGVVQFIVRVPPSAPTGAVQMTVGNGAAQSPAVTLSLH